MPGLKVTMSANASKKSLRKRSIATVVSFACAGLALLGVLLNEPIGQATQVRGTIESLCVPRGRQSNVFACTARLTDGSYLTFQNLRPLSRGTGVIFMRRDRRYVGRHYELVNVDP